MFYYLLATLFVINCFVLLLVVLIQQGKGGDIASAFGGGSSQAAFGARSGATLLTKVTWVSAGLFFAGALALSLASSQGPGSVIGSVPAPAQSQPAPTQPAPAQSAPGQPAQAQPSEPPAPAPPQ
jgi:preprotein translocase subunit SecG